MKTAIGIDIGGTKISIAAATRSGKILAYSVLPTQKGRRTREGIKTLLAEIRLLLADLAPQARAGLSGIGVCLPGVVDRSSGVVPRSPNLPGWKGLPLASLLARTFHLPVHMINDAKAAALGEMLFGAARRAGDFVYVTVSTGIGSGIVINGCLLEGSGFVAGEIGHMTLVPEGQRCNCGKRGCLEAYASGSAIERAAVPHFGRITARDLSAKAEKGNAPALKIFERAGFYLGVGLANVLNVLNPELIVLGGGVIQSAPDVFWKSMRRSLKSDAWPEALRSVRIRRTALKKNAGNLGALALVFDSQTSKSR